MGPKLAIVLTFFLIIAAGAAAQHFGFLGLDDFAYVGKLIAGWTVYTCVIALLYAGLERLLPGILCPPAADEASKPPAA